MNYIIFNKTIGKFLEGVKYEVMDETIIDDIKKYIVLNPDSPKNKNYCTSVNKDNANIKDVKFY